jgi:hypothetical protein
VTESILDSVKKSLQLSPEYDVFDPDIIMHINSVFSTLTQLGIGPATGFMIEDDQPTWDAFIGDTPALNMVKTYTFLKVKIVFDPPGTSFHLDAIQKVIAEYEWRIHMYREITPPTIVMNMPAENIIDGGGAQHL